MVLLISWDAGTTLLRAGQARATVGAAAGGLSGSGRWAPLHGASADHLCMRCVFIADATSPACADPDGDRGIQRYPAAGC